MTMNLEDFGINLEELTLNEKEFIDKLPIDEGKVVSIEIVNETDYNGKDVKNMHMYILNKKTNIIQRQIIKISNSKKSKYYRLVKAINGINAPIKSFKDLLGVIAKWDWDVKEFKIKDDVVESGLYIPTIYLDKEPVTKEELYLVEETKRKIEKARNNSIDELTF